MTLNEVIAGLNLPPAATSGARRVPKNAVVEHLPRPLARAFDEGTERLRWVATLKAATVGLASGSLALSTGDPVPVPELLVFRLEAREGARVPALVEAVHRAVYMHLLLIVEHQGALNLSTALKRGSLADAQKVVLSGDPVVAPPLMLAGLRPWEAELLAALALDHRPEADLGTLYQRWSGALMGGQVAGISGHFRLVTEPAGLALREGLLADFHRTTAELGTLSRELGRASQVRDRVDLSTRLKRAEADLARIRALL